MLSMIACVGLRSDPAHSVTAGGARLHALTVRGPLCQALIQPKRIFIANMQNASTSVMPLAAITGMLPIPMP